LLSNFAAELCNYHKQNYLTKKNKRQRISYYRLGASPKKTTIYEEKKKREEKNP